MVKQITYNAKVSDIEILRKKKHRLEKRFQGSWEWNSTWVNHNAEKIVMFNSSCTLLSLNLAELIFLKEIFL